MKFRKYAAIALAGAMCMSLLAGCGDKKDDTSKDSTTASNAEATSGESTDASAEEENIKATITTTGGYYEQFEVNILYQAGSGANKNFTLSENSIVSNSKGKSGILILTYNA